MVHKNAREVWASGGAYEAFIGRWSRLVVREFLDWLNVPASKHWLDVGCGTGAITSAILERALPDSVKGIDPSEGFVKYAREQIKDQRANFETGDARSLPFETESFDAVIAGLILNFVPEPAQALAEMTRVARIGGTVAAYVWDYSGEMQLVRYFWNAAIALNPAARDIAEDQRFAICRPEALTQLFKQAGLQAVAVRAIDIATPFQDFNDYWLPFLGGQGPAPGYVMSLTEEQRNELAQYLRARLPFAPDGSIPLMARAWAARGIKFDS